MTSRDTRQRHVRRVLPVVHDLWQRLPLAAMAHFSPCLCHRTCVAVMGEGVHDARQRWRLQLAAWALRSRPCL